MSIKKLGSRLEVMNNKAIMTISKLKKEDLKYNKYGKIVSRKKSNIAKNKYLFTKNIIGGFHTDSSDGIVCTLKKYKLKTKMTGKTTLDDHYQKGDKVSENKVKIKSSDLGHLIYFNKKFGESKSLRCPSTENNCFEIPIIFSTNIIKTDDKIKITNFPFLWEISNHNNIDDLYFKILEILINKHKINIDLINIDYINIRNMFKELIKYQKKQLEEEQKKQKNKLEKQQLNNSNNLRILIEGQYKETNIPIPTTNEMTTLIKTYSLYILELLNNPKETFIKVIYYIFLKMCVDDNDDNDLCLSIYYYIEILKINLTISKYYKDKYLKIILDYLTKKDELDVFYSDLNDRVLSGINFETQRIYNYRS